MSRTSHRRAAVLALLVPILTAGLVATAGSASAIPIEGDPTPTTCLRVVAMPSASDTGSPLFVSHGYIAVLVPKADC
jgi:hypothetical protein